jgi:hypothetical protein
LTVRSLTSQVACWRSDWALRGRYLLQRRYRREARARPLRRRDAVSRLRPRCWASRSAPEYTSAGWRPPSWVPRCPHPAIFTRRPIPRDQQTVCSVLRRPVVGHGLAPVTRRAGRVLGSCMLLWRGACGLAMYPSSSRDPAAAHRIHVVQDRKLWSRVLAVDRSPCRPVSRQRANPSS